MRRRGGELGLDDRRERQVAERAAARPTLVGIIRQDALGTGARVELGQGGDPVDPRGAVALAAPGVGVGEVVGQDPRLSLGEAERLQPADGVLDAQL